MKPLIGIVAYSQIYEAYAWEYDVSYAMNSVGIERAGGLPILIPARLSSESLRAIFEKLDGLLLPGGGDIDPRHYDAERHEKTAGVDNVRDTCEIQLARWAMAVDMPTFGICRGIQLLNVALGGTLHQDVPSQLNGDVYHNHPLTSPRNELAHPVQIMPDSLLADIIKQPVVQVNSLHHQGVNQLAESVRVVATAADGLVEAIELPDKKFALAVQWHPEDLLQVEVMQKLFDAFVEAARERMPA